MIRAKKIIFILTIAIFSLLGIGLASASSTSVWQGQYYTGTTFNTGTYTFNFTVYDALTGGNACFTNTVSLTTGSWGQWTTEQSPWATCNNASKDYFLNINIAGTDEVPRRRLTVSDFLRRDVEETKNGSLVVSENVTANYYFGDGRYLTGINGSGDINSVEGDNIYIYNGSSSGNVILAFNESKLNATIDLRSAGGDNSSWNESYANTLYYLKSNPFGFYNSTDFSISNYFTKAELLGFNYYNSTDFSIGDYYLKSNPFGFYNSTSPQIELDPLWTSNYSLYNLTWSTNTQKNATGYLYNDTTTIYLNETLLNATIDLRSAGGDNSSWNESYANTKYLNLSGGNANQNINIGIYNLTIGDKLIFRSNEFIDNLIDGWLRITGGLNVTGNSVFNGGVNATNDSYFLADLYVAGKLKGLSPVEVEGGLNVTGETTFNNNVNFTGMVYGNGSQLTDIEADTLATSSVTTNSIADNNITDVKILNLSWSKLTSVPTGLDDGDNNTLYYNSTGLDLNSSNYFSIRTGYKMPQGCSDGEIAEYNTTSLGWDCGVDNSASSGMSNWNLAASDTGGSESINESETVTFSDDNKYLNATRITNTITYSINEIKLNETIDLRDDDTTYSDLLNFTNGANYWNSTFATFNKTYADTLYYGITNPFGFYNSTDFSISDYSTTSDILSWNYYNSTDFSIGDYYLNSNPFGFWNDTYATFNETYANTLYAPISVTGDNSSWNESYANTKYLNLSGTNANQNINISPYTFETTNLTLTKKITFGLGQIIDNIVSGWIRITGGLNVTEDAVVAGNITVEGIKLEQDTTNHRIYDNATCVIIKGDTSTMYIC